MAWRVYWCETMNINKVALVIGGTGGIGRAIAEYLADKGMMVYATYRDDTKKTEFLRAPLKNCVLLHCDVTNEMSVCAVVREIIEKESKIDILINATCSGLKLKTIDHLTIDEFKEDIEVILVGSINVCKNVLQQMKEKKNGVIIHILTTAIDGTSPPRMSSYVAAKSGLSGFLGSLAAEVGSFGIRVVGVSPSFVETKLLNAFPKKLLDMEKEKRPDKMFLQPSDIAGVAFNIIENEATYPNGKNVFLYSREDARKHIG